MKSIQTKLIVTILVIFVIALATLGGLNYWKARSITLANIQQDMVDIAGNSVGDIADWFDARKAELSIVAVTPEVLGGNQETIQPFLAGVVNSRKIYDSMGYIRLDGSYFNSTGAKGSLADREYFQRASKGEIVVSDPVVSKSTGKTIVTVALPLKNGERIIGVIYGSIGMDSLSKKFWASRRARPGMPWLPKEMDSESFIPIKNWR